MIKAIGRLAGLAALAASGSALAQADPSPVPPIQVMIAPPADAEELAESRAIMDIMFPPAERDQTIRRLIGDFAGQVEASLGGFMIKDAGLKAIIDDFRAHALEEVSATAQVHLPNIIEATAVAYTREFSLEELKEMHAFALTPTGRHFLSRSAALISDPAVAAANTTYLREVRAVIQPMQEELRRTLTTYLQNHPALARDIERRNRES